MKKARGCTQIPIFGAGTFFGKLGHPGPAELAPLQGLSEFRKHPDFQERLTRSRGRRKCESRLASLRLLGSFRFDQRRVSDSGCSRNGPSWPLASQHAESRLTDPRPVWQAPSGCQPKVASKQGDFWCCTAHGLVRRKSGRVTRRAKAFVSCEVLLLIGVSDFALTRLQNLASGAWLKRRASVAAEASGRGLVVGGSNCQRRKDRRKT